MERLRGRAGHLADSPSLVGRRSKEPTPSSNLPFAQAVRGGCGVVQSQSVMFCPQCKAEYRPGFSRCSDCDVDLVEEPSKSGNSENEPTYSSLETMKSVWTGQDQARCVSLCERLRAVGIPFRVDQRQCQYLLGTVEHYKICVPPEFFNDARKMIIKGRLDLPDARSPK